MPLVFGNEILNLWLCCGTKSFTLKQVGEDDEVIAQQVNNQCTEAIVIMTLAPER